MKKIIMTVAIVCAAAFAQAASVGWSVATGSATYGGDAYKMFIIGEKGVSDIATITALLDAGTSVDSYAFGSGTLSAAGSATVAAAGSGASIDIPENKSFTSFVVLFDSATPTAGKSKYVVISGLANQTKAVTTSSASVTFATGNASSIVGNASNWQSFGSVPEPTSGLLLLLGMAGLALKRKVA